MDEREQRDWQALHRRVASGGTLSAAEQASYDAGCHVLDLQEQSDGESQERADLERLRDLRAQVAQAQAAQQPLRRQEAALDDRIARLEARLDDRTRHLLGLVS